MESSVVDASDILAEVGGVEAAARLARSASRRVGLLPTAVKNAVLHTLADLIERDRVAILKANAADLAVAGAAGLPTPKLQRLTLNDASVGQLAAGVRQIAALPDPVGEVTRDTTVPSGLRVRKLRAPLGVIAMIYEARPGVTIDAFALCFKAGNACILKGGKEAAVTNAVLAGLVRDALAEHRAPVDAIVNLSGAPREATETLLGLSGLIDLVIPRGGPDLIRFVHERSRIPTVQHFQGVCHIFVDESADLDTALAICLSAKISAPATCNAAECILVHKNIADRFVPRMVAKYHEMGVEVRGTPLVQAIAPAAGCVTLALPEDFGREFLDLIVSMRVVADVHEAVEHIATYGSCHTEAILTGDLGPAGAAEIFTREVQASCVLVNASTRFNDGFQLGLGAEIGISTSRVHAYGPMGLEELTTQRWVVTGEGQAR